jgi:hypothetical protein
LQQSRPNVNGPDIYNSNNSSEQASVKSDNLSNTQDIFNGQGSPIHNRSRQNIDQIKIKSEQLSQSQNFSLDSENIFNGQGSPTDIYNTNRSLHTSIDSENNIFEQASNFKSQNLEAGSTNFYEQYDRAHHSDIGFQFGNTNAASQAATDTNTLVKLNAPTPQTCSQDVPTAIDRSR